MNQKDDQKETNNLKKMTISPNITINDDFERFSEYDSIFGRVNWDKTLKSYKTYMYDKVPQILDENQPGYSQIDHALAIASWTVHDYFKNAFSWEKLGSPNNMMPEAITEQYKITDENIERVTKTIKAVAKSFGASLVGIAPFNINWVYTEDRVGTPFDLPEGLTAVIAIAIEMDADTMSTSPSMTQGFASGMGYSQMAFIVSSLAEFIRKLGYRAIPMGNDTALSIPIAVEAGLGQVGRNGLLTTREFGARVRLCKVFTDMPLQFDERVDFGLTEYCLKCKRCAEACENEAISFDDDPSYKTHTKSNMKGVYRWTVNVDKCYDFWVDNGGECSTCIAICPFNQRTGKAFTKPTDYWEKRLAEQ
ncbi:MAG: reductive dehalogenase [Asgard group archaeon]|nr:reductive dehalogenase [Asgard group archaeon]